MFVRTLHTWLAAKLGMPSSLQKQGPQLWRNLQPPSVPLCSWLARKKPLHLPAMRPRQWPGSGRTCVVQCFASWVGASQTDTVCQLYIATLHLASVWGPHQDGGGSKSCHVFLTPCCKSRPGKLIVYVFQSKPQKVRLDSEFTVVRMIWGPVPSPHPCEHRSMLQEDPRQPHCHSECPLQRPREPTFSRLLCWKPRSWENHPSHSTSQRGPVSSRSSHCLGEIPQQLLQGLGVGERCLVPLPNASLRLRKTIRVWATPFQQSTACVSVHELLQCRDKMVSHICTHEIHIYSSDRI